MVVGANLDEIVRCFADYRGSVSSIYFVMRLKRILKISALVLSLSSTLDLVAFAT